MSYRLGCLLTAAFVITIVGMDTAAAHHAMGGALPSTFGDGLISGLAHPIIGIDHLAFIIAVGVAAALAGLSYWIPVCFVAASAMGIGIHLAAFDLPAPELIVALSVLLAGVLLVVGTALSPLVWASLFAVAGIFHGYAYAEAIIGAEAAPLGAYLVGLIAVQSVVVVAVMLLIRHRRALTAAAMEPRLAGAFAVGVGLSALMGQILPG